MTAYDPRGDATNLPSPDEVVRREAAERLRMANAVETDNRRRRERLARIAGQRPAISEAASEAARFSRMAERRIQRAKAIERAVRSTVNR